MVVTQASELTPPTKTHTPNSTLKSHHTIIHGDSRQMNLLADRSVHLVVTSPPYWQLKDYGTENQIGLHESDINIVNRLARSVHGVECGLTDEQKSGIARGLKDVDEGWVRSHNDIKIQYGL